MRKFVLTLLASTALASTAQVASAADLAPIVRKAPPPAPVASPYNWSGLYIGGHIGAGWSRNSFSAPDDTFCGFDGFSICDLGSHNGLGFIGGGQIGINFQSGPVVFGVEGDYSWANVRGDHSDSFGASFGAGDGFVLFDASNRFKTKVDGIATFAARLGLAAGPGDRTLFYVKGGGAYMRQTVSSDFFGTITFCDDGCDSIAFSGNASSKKDRWGWMVGAGIEHGLFDGWSAKIEYNYLDFGDKTATLNGTACVAFFGDPTECGGISLDTKVKTEIHMVKVGLNYRFASDWMR